MKIKILSVDSFSLISENDSDQAVLNFFDDNKFFGNKGTEDEDNIIYFSLIGIAGIEPEKK